MMAVSRWFIMYGMMQEYTRKEAEHAKTAADLQESYAAACRKMGIEVHVTEISLGAADLSKLYARSR